MSLFTRRWPSAYSDDNHPDRLPPLAESGNDPWGYRDLQEEDERYSRADYDEALRQMIGRRIGLASDDAMRHAGQTVMRIDVAPEEHALLLAARALRDAKQAYEDAATTWQRVHGREQATRAAYWSAETTLDGAQGAYDDALHNLTAPTAPLRTGMDCS